MALSPTIFSISTVGSRRRGMEFSAFSLPGSLPSWSSFGYCHGYSRPSTSRHSLYEYSGQKKTMAVISNSRSTMKSKKMFYSSTNQDAGACLVTPPPRGTKPRAIIKLLGGAFVGAIPQLTYGYLTELLAKEGFLVVAVPYNVTFDHAQAAKEVFLRFNACLDFIFASGLPDFNLAPNDLACLPLYSVGHSNGALLQVLAGSYFQDRIPEANVIIAFNNRPANEAVPYFEQLGPFVTQVTPIAEASPVYPMAKGASEDAWKALGEIAGSLVSDYDQESLTFLSKFVDQLPSVADQVAQGVSEFKPTPLENRQLIEQSYNVQRTLLVKFNVDAIDETDLLEATLKPRIGSLGGQLEKITLDGTHITPCIQVGLQKVDMSQGLSLAFLKPGVSSATTSLSFGTGGPVWQVGDLFTPADAILQGFKSMMLNDTRMLATTISGWLDQRG